MQSKYSSVNVYGIPGVSVQLAAFKKPTLYCEQSVWEYVTNLGLIVLAYAKAIDISPKSNMR